MHPLRRYSLLHAVVVALFAASVHSIPQVSSTLKAKSVAHRTGATQYVEVYDDVDNSNEQFLGSKSQQDDVDYEVYQGVVGRPGIDFPIWFKIPQTSFSCRTHGNGYFADLETDCQVFHICEEGRKISFLCPNGTIFQQSELTCDWWFKVNCAMPRIYTKPVVKARKHPKYVYFSKNVGAELTKRIDSAEDFSTDNVETFDSSKEREHDREEPVLPRITPRRNLTTTNHRPSRNDASHEVQKSRGKIRHRSSFEVKPTKSKELPKSSNKNILFIYRTKTSAQSNRGKFSAEVVTASPAEGVTTSKKAALREQRQSKPTTSFRTTTEPFEPKYATLATTMHTPSHSEPVGSLEIVDMIRTFNYLVMNNTNSKRIGLAKSPLNPNAVISLASFFSNHSRSTHKQAENVQAVPGLFSNKTLDKYTSLFGSSRETTDSEKDRLEQDKRQIAQTFSNALSSYLNNPVEFRRILAQIRPTEPTDNPLPTSEQPTTETQTEIEFITSTEPVTEVSTLAPSLALDDELLQRAQSQSFVKYLNRKPELPPARTNEVISEPAGVTTTESPWKYISDTAYLNPLSINEQLMTETTTKRIPTTTTSTTTPSPNTYLPNATPQTHVQNQTEVELGQAPTMGEPEMQRLQSSNGMERTAKRIFGDLQQADANHLMNMMKKAESNTNILKLILLLVQTCEEDNGKSRKSLLNTLIQMDNSKAKSATEPTVPITTFRPPPTTTATSIESFESQSTPKVTEKRESSDRPATIFITEKIADLRSLELLKSLYALASKYGRRR